jgi:hypothetical protein
MSFVFVSLLNFTGVINITSGQKSLGKGMKWLVEILETRQILQEN